MHVAPGIKFLAIPTLCLALCWSSTLSLSLAAEGEPKHTIKEVMKVAHGKDAGLVKKVVDGNATDDEKKQLLDMYISLLESKPKKGDAASWQELAGKAAMAAAKVVVGREGAAEQLTAATNCKACHSVHK